MTLKLYSHPFSSYCQKVIMALYEREIAFEPVMVDFGDPASIAAFRSVWPMTRMPALVDEAAGRTVVESSVIIEYLDGMASSMPGLVPAGRDEALEVRFWDRFFDNYVQGPMQRIVFEHVRPEGERDPQVIEQATGQLHQAYGYLEARLGGRHWAATDRLTMADCAAAPALFYANDIVPVDAAHTALHAYYDRLMNRPSYRRILAEAEPYFAKFPIGRPPRMPTRTPE